MTLSDQMRAHLAQCHREDETERLAALLAAENDRLRAEIAATDGRRWPTGFYVTGPDSDGNAWLHYKRADGCGGGVNLGQGYLARAALNGEAGA